MAASITEAICLYPKDLICHLVGWAEQNCRDVGKIAKISNGKPWDNSLLTKSYSQKNPRRMNSRVTFIEASNKM